MTTYFDEFASRVAALRQSHPGDWIALQKLEEVIVRDVSVIAESPGFPPDLRDAIHKTIVAHAVTCQPLLPNLRPRENPRADDETGDAMYREVAQLGWDLHTVFHQLAMMDIGYNDSPLQYVGELAMRGEEYRERLAAAELGVVPVAPTRMEDKYEHGILDVCERVHGQLSGTFEDACTADHVALVAWLDRRVNEGWSEPTTPYEAVVRALGRATVAEARAAGLIPRGQNPLDAAAAQTTTNATEPTP